MKTRISIGWVFGMVWAAMAATPGFAQDGLNPAPTTVSSDATAAAVLAPATGPASRSLPAASPVPGNAGEKAPVPNAPLSASSHEVQRLTQAGLDERVILAYITNSPGTFDLSPDTIIHLKNLGLSSTAISAMILHDQDLASSSLRMTGQVSVQPASLVTPLDPPSHSPILANDEPWASGALFLSEDDYAPEQPEDIGPVRAPYPVKLSDPIIILKLPSFRLQYW